MHVRALLLQGALRRNPRLFLSIVARSGVRDSDSAPPSSEPVILLNTAGLRQLWKVVPRDFPLVVAGPDADSS